MTTADFRLQYFLKLVFTVTKMYKIYLIVK
jgi:hypothetical protein